MNRINLGLAMAVAALIPVTALVLLTTPGGSVVQGHGQMAVHVTTIKPTATKVQHKADSVAPVSLASAVRCNPKANYTINRSAHTLSVWSRGHLPLCKGDQVYVGVGVNTYAKPYAVFSQSTLGTTVPQNRAWTSQIHYWGGKTAVFHYPSYCGSQVDFYSSRNLIRFPAHIKGYGAGNGESTPIYTYLTGTGYSAVYPVVNCQPKPVVKASCPANCAGRPTVSVSLPGIAGSYGWHMVSSVWQNGKLVRRVSYSSNRGASFSFVGLDKSTVTVVTAIVGRSGAKKWSTTVYCPVPGAVSITTPTAPCGCTGVRYTFTAHAVGKGYIQWVVVYDNHRPVVSLHPGQSWTLTAKPGHTLQAQNWGQSGTVRRYVWDAHKVGA